MNRNRNVWIGTAAMGLAVLLAGCGRPEADPPRRRRTVRRVVIIKKRSRSDPKASSTKRGGPARSEPGDGRPAPPTNVPWRRGDGSPVDLSDNGSSDLSEPGLPGVADVVDALFTEFADARSAAPTVVIWLIDESPSARQWHGAVLDRIGARYRQLQQERKTSQSRESLQPLETVVGVFGAELQWVVASPTADAGRIAQVLHKLPAADGAVEHPFAAVTTAVQRFLDLRLKERKELFVVVVTDEAGDDDRKLPEAVAEPRKYGIPIHVVGLPAPFGRRTVSGQQVEGGSDEVPRADQPVVVRRGPETWAVERIELDFPDEVSVPPAIDSGFGPYALECLAHETGGRFHALAPPSWDASGWSSGSMRRFSRSVMQGYRPKFMRREKYDKLVSQNKAVQVLLQAARLPRVAVLTNPTLVFNKGDQAKLKVALDRAQRAAAKVELDIHRMYDLLWSGAADRKKLTDRRWRASYDLAMGRIAAARARVDGYNAMLAALKRGVPSKDQNATQWVLEPHESTDVSSSIKGLAKHAREFLTRVKQEHPGTPWAYLAEQELQVPLGWRWSER